MTRPYHYARWAEEADPKCSICRGIGVAYFTEIPPLALWKIRPGANRISSVTLGTYQSRCECAKRPDPGATGDE